MTITTVATFKIAIVIIFWQRKLQMWRPIWISSSRKRSRGEATHHPIPSGTDWRQEEPSSVLQRITDFTKLCPDISTLRVGKINQLIRCLSRWAWLQCQRRWGTNCPCSGHHPAPEIQHNQGKQFWLHIAEAVWGCSDVQISVHRDCLFAKRRAWAPRRSRSDH